MIALAHLKSAELLATSVIGLHGDRGLDIDLSSCLPIRFRNLNGTADRNQRSQHSSDRNESTETGSTPAVPAKRTTSSRASFLSAGPEYLRSSSAMDCNSSVRRRSETMPVGLRCFRPNHWCTVHGMRQSAPVSIASLASLLLALGYQCRASRLSEGRLLRTGASTIEKSIDPEKRAWHELGPSLPSNQETADLWGGDDGPTSRNVRDASQHATAEGFGRGVDKLGGHRPRRSGRSKPKGRWWLCRTWLTSTLLSIWSRTVKSAHV